MAARQPSLTNQLLRAPLLLFWCGFLLLMPFYVLPVGLPQPDDAMVVILAPLVLASWNGRLSRASIRTLRPLLWFTLWVVLVNVAWILILANFGKDLRYPLFYIFNALVFVIALILHERHGELFVRLTYVCVFAAVMFQCAFSLVFRSSLARDTLFFDNPNQLGYYALLAACVITLTQRRLKIGLFTSSIAITGCGYLALISASRSAVAGVVILVILSVFSNPRLIVIGSLFAVLLFVAGGPVARAVDSMQHRMSSSRGDESLSFFEQRGYDRIWSNKEYLVLGAGEGARARFQETTVIKHAEIHSSIGTIVFSYGIVGLGLFILFIARLVEGSPWRTMLVLLPPLTYTVAHQGLRFTMLWVLLALFVALKSPATRAPSLRVAH